METRKVSYTSIINWLSVNGFVLAFKKMPHQGIKEFKFTKKGTIAIVTFPVGKEPYCTLTTDIHCKDGKELSLSSIKFKPFDDTNLDKLFKDQQRIKKELEEIGNEPNTKEILWEMWFYASIFLFATAASIALIKGKDSFFPYWPYLLIATFLNLMVCLLFKEKKK